MLIGDAVPLRKVVRCQSLRSSTRLQTVVDVVVYVDEGRDPGGSDWRTGVRRRSHLGCGGGEVEGVCMIYVGANTVRCTECEVVCLLLSQRSIAWVLKALSSGKIRRADLYTG